MIPSTDDIESGEIDQDPRAMMAQAQAKMDARIDAKVEAMRPGLNDSQVDQYRKDLKLKSGGVFGGLLNGFQPRKERSRSAAASRPTLYFSGPRSSLSRAFFSRASLKKLFNIDNTLFLHHSHCDLAVVISKVDCFGVN